MPMSDAILAEFTHEAVGTRKTLERVPEGRNDWRPHPKSTALGNLAGHLAQLPMWVGVTLQRDQFDINPPNGPKYPGYVMTSREDLLATFDGYLKEAKEAIAATCDEEFRKPWTFLNGGVVAFTQPKVAVLRSFVMSHTVHHRAQLGVYLRMNDVAVPSIYGPSADEKF
jgi:uncharacterized damage-inducible protein DinB